MLVSHESVQSTGCSDDDVWVSLLVLENLSILLDGSPTIENSGLDFWHVFAESGILVLDLVSQLTGMAHDEDGGFASDWVDLLEGGEDEDGSLTKTRFGLAEDIGTKNGLGNANLLDCRVNRTDVRLRFSKSVMRCKVSQRPSIFAV